MLGHGRRIMQTNFALSGRLALVTGSSRGLGLAIAKSITQAHDGTLTLAPRAAGGLRVTVQLPAAPPHTGR